MWTMDLACDVSNRCMCDFTPSSTILPPLPNTYGLFLVQDENSKSLLLILMGASYPPLDENSKSPLQDENPKSLLLMILMGATPTCLE